MAPPGVDVAAGFEAPRHQLDRDGFLVLRHVFQPEDLDDARTRLDALFSQWANLGRHLTKDLGHDGAEPGSAIPEINRPSRVSPELRRTRLFRKTHDIAAALYGRRVGYLFDHAIYKLPETGGAIPWHQDASYAGYEDAPTALHFWIPLQRTDANSGCLCYVRGSHTGPLYRDGSPGPRVPDTHEIDERLIDPERIVACPVDAGDLVVHTPRTIHGSRPNRSPTVRRAWILHFGPWGRVQKLRPVVVRWFRRVAGR